MDFKRHLLGIPEHCNDSQEGLARGIPMEFKRNFLGIHRHSNLKWISREDFLGICRHCNGFQDSDFRKEFLGIALAFKRHFLGIPKQSNGFEEGIS